MADAKWKKLQDGVTKRLDKMIESGKSVRAYAARNMFPKYQEYQMLRWASENEGGWHPLNQKYAEYKKIKYAGYVGNGTKMMIATGELLNSALVRPGAHGRALFTDKSMEISISGLSYAKHADEQRTFSTFSPAFKQQMRADLFKYLRGDS